MWADRVRARSRSVLSVLLAIALVSGLAACVPAEPPSSSLSATAADPSTTLSVEELTLTSEMQDAAFGEVTIGGSSEVRAATGAVTAAAPATLIYTFESPLAAETQGTIAYWNDERSWWEPLSTTLSEDRTVLSAQTTHLSPFAWIQEKLTDASIATYNFLGRATGTQAEGPECAADRKPVWAAPVFVDDINGMIRWCYEREAGDPDVLVVKLVLNRNYLGLVSSAIEPRFAVHGLLGESPPTVSRMLAETGFENATGADGYVLNALGSIELRYSKDQLKEFYRSSDAALVEVNVFPWYGVMTEMFSSLKLEFGNDRATFLSVVGLLAVCGGALVSVSSGDDAAAAFGDVADCAVRRAEDVAKVVAGAMVDVLDLDWEESKALGRSIGRSAGRLLVWWQGTKFALNLTAILGDSTLDPINRRFMFYPSDTERAEFLASPQLSDCQAIYSPEMFARLEADGGRLNTPAEGLTMENYAGMSSVIDGMSDFLEEHVDDFTCDWMTSSLHYGIETRIIELSAQEKGRVAGMLQGSGFDSEPLAGGTRYFSSGENSEGVYGESHFLRDDLFIATHWSGLGPVGYTADIVAQLDR